MKLLIDEMYSPALARALRDRGHDAVSVHDESYRHLQGEPDDVIFAAAIEARRTILTENVGDFIRIQSIALARGCPAPPMILTGDRQFPRAHPTTLGHLVRAIELLLLSTSVLNTNHFLKPDDG